MGLIIDSKRHLFFRFLTREVYRAICVPNECHLKVVSNYSIIKGFSEERFRAEFFFQSKMTLWHNY